MLSILFNFCENTTIFLDTLTISLGDKIDLQFEKCSDSLSYLNFLLTAQEDVEAVSGKLDAPETRMEEYEDNPSTSSYSRLQTR